MNAIRTQAAVAGYSGTPLARKLGLKEGSQLLALDAPEGYRHWLAPLPANLVFASRLGANVDVIHLFVTGKSKLARTLKSLRSRIRADAALWVSWPKKSAGVPSEVSEDLIRELALPLGFVDIKVCAVSDVWSGLKLVIRKSLR